jgi:hypothetical protein
MYETSNNLSSTCLFVKVMSCATRPCLNKSSYQV